MFDSNVFVNETVIYVMRIEFDVCFRRQCSSLVLAGTFVHNFNKKTIILRFGIE